MVYLSLAVDCLDFVRLSHCPTVPDCSLCISVCVCVCICCKLPVIVLTCIVQSDWRAELEQNSSWVLNTRQYPFEYPFAVHMIMIYWHSSHRCHRYNRDLTNLTQLILIWKQIRQKQLPKNIMLHTSRGSQPTLACLFVCVCVSKRTKTSYKILGKMS